jgi:hypothetical protein
MIPGKLVRFLEEHANVGMVGTRDRHLVPYGHRVSGWHVAADRRTVTAIISKRFTDRLVESLEDNGELALVVEEFPSHETYQFKGRYLQHRPLQPADFDAIERIRGRFEKSMKPIYPEAPTELLRAFTLMPSLAVEFEVREIYLQTPGPGAGARLVPPPDGQ